MEEKILVSQDLSCLGQAPLSVALSILGARNYQPDILPTTILSTHTGEFGGNTFLDLGSEMSKITAHWRGQKIDSKNLYLGYLSKETIDSWLSYISDFKDNNVLLDPAMVDSGKLYHGLDTDYVTKMRILIKSATALTPSLTEACLLLGKSYRDFSINEIKKLVLELKERLKLKKVIITDIPMKEKIRMVEASASDQVFIIENEKVGRSFFGTEDMFASSLLVAILAGYSLKEGVEIAATFIRMTTEVTDLTQDRRLGPNYTGALPWLINKSRERG